MNVNPIVTGSLRSAGVTPGLTPEKILVVAQQLGGTAISGALQVNIQDDKAWDTLYGEDSPLATAIRRIRRRNKETQIDAIGIDEAAGGVLATGTMAITGTATEDGELIFSIGSEKFHAFKIAVTSGDTADVIGIALAAAIALDDTVLVTAANVTGTVTLTAKSKGTFGNTTGLKVTGSVGGASVAVTAMASGATDPTLTGIFDVIGEERYQGILWQFDQELAVVTDFLDARFNVSNKIQDGRAFVGRADTQANILSELTPLNSLSLTMGYYALVDTATHRGGNVLEVPFIGVSEFVGIRGLRRTDGAILGDLVISRSQGDSFGGIGLNSKPYFNTPFFDQTPAEVGTSFTELEIRQIEDAGGWVIDNNSANNTVIAGRVKTTRTTDVAGNLDPTFGALNFVDTATAAREIFVNRTRARYPQFRATAGALIPGFDSANEASVAAFVAGIYSDLGDVALVIKGIGTVDGATIDFDKKFKDELIVTLNTVTGSFAVSAVLNIVNQLTGVVYDFAIALEV